MTNIKQVKGAAEIAKQVIGKNALSPQLLDEFNSVFKEASAAAANINSNEWELKEKKKMTFDERVKINYSRAPYGKTIFEQGMWATYIEPINFLKGKNRYYSFHEKADAENASDGKLKLIWKK